MAATTPDTRFFGHPAGLSTLFFTELWERFSYYGMRAILILYMTAAAAQGGLGFNIATAGAVYGLFTSSVYLTGLPGGWLADRFLGQRRAVLLGGLLIAAGNFLLMTASLAAFFGGLVLISFGTGLLKTNATTMVGLLYGQGDHRRDAGFSIYYMGINTGATVAPLAVGWVGQQVNFRLAFGLAGCGMLLGLLQYMVTAKRLEGAGLQPPSPAGAAQRRQLGYAAGLLALVVGAASLLGVTVQMVADAFGLLLILVVLVTAGALLLTGDLSTVERKRIAAVFLLFLAAALFWSSFEQAGSTLNLFAKDRTDNRVFGIPFPSSFLQALNGLFIVLLAPVFAWLWMRLGKNEPSVPMKFSLGLVAVGLGFAILVPAAMLSADGAKVAPIWLTATYLLHTVGELSLSPVGLSAMTKLAPARIAGFVMGIWFLSMSTGNYLGGRMASLYESLPLETLFGAVGGFAIAAGLVLALFRKPIVRLMGGVE